MPLYPYRAKCLGCGSDTGEVVRPTDGPATMGAFISAPWVEVRNCATCGPKSDLAVDGGAFNARKVACPAFGCLGTLSYRGSCTTLVGYPKYKDNAGVWHDHDDNCASADIECSASHGFVLRVRRRCTAPGCLWRGKAACWCHPFKVKHDLATATVAEMEPRQ